MAPSEPLHTTAPLSTLALCPHAVGHRPVGSDSTQSYVTQAAVAAHGLVGTSGFAAVHLPSLCGSLEPSEPLHFTDPNKLLEAWPQADGHEPSGCVVCQSYATQAAVAAHGLVGAAGFAPAQSFSPPSEPSEPLQATLPATMLAALPHSVEQVPAGSICAHSYVTHAAVAAHAFVGAAGFVPAQSLPLPSEPSLPLQTTVPVRELAALPHSVEQVPSGSICTHAYVTHAVVAAQSAVGTCAEARGRSTHCTRHAGSIYWVFTKQLPANNIHDTGPWHTPSTAVTCGSAPVHLPSLCGSIERSDPTHFTNPARVLAAWPHAVGHDPSGCVVSQSYVTHAAVAAHVLVAGLGLAAVQSLSLPSEPSDPLHTTALASCDAACPQALGQAPVGCETSHV